MSDTVLRHYESFPYPRYSLMVSVHPPDTYALNLDSLWARFNGTLPPPNAQRILLAGCGSFSPYPVSLANPSIPVTALDLSQRSLKRARLHCLLHGRRNVAYLKGDLLDPATAPGPFGFVDCFGVLHHLDDPLKGLKALAARTCDGGILRIMVYSRYARREEESIRRAFRLLGIRDVATARRLISRAPAESRLSRWAVSSPEGAWDEGIADALLHPSVRTFRIDELRELALNSGLEPLLFAHQGALAEPEREMERLREMERQKLSPGNFILYLGKDVAGPCSDRSNSRIMLNPCLRAVVSPLRLPTPYIAPRLGIANPVLTRTERRFLARFKRPRAEDTLTPEELDKTVLYRRALFLVQFNP